VGTYNSESQNGDEGLFCIPHSYAFIGFDKTGDGRDPANLGFAGISWDLPQKQSQHGGAVPDIYIIYHNYI
jgi:hypothetical protein